MRGMRYSPLEKRRALRRWLDEKGHLKGRKTNKMLRKDSVALEGAV